MQVLRLLLVSGAALLLGCDNRPPAATEQGSAADTTPPVISYVILNRNPNPTVPQAALLSLSTDEPTEMTIRIDDGEQSWDATSSDGFATEHSLMVLGMRLGRMHHISAVVSDRSGNVSETPPLPLEMPPLPAHLAKPELIVRNPESMEPGVTMFNVFLLPPGGEQPDDTKSALYIVNDRGETIWYYHPDLEVVDARRLSNGNLLYSTGDASRGVEIDMLGNVVQQWHAVGTAQDVPEGSTPVEMGSIHHEISEMPSGNLLTLSSEVRVVQDFPTSDTDPDAAPGPASVIGDVIVEFSRDGTIVREWKLLDIVDPYRIGYGSLDSGYWVVRYEDLIEDVDAEPIRDWAHANALIYDPSDDSYIVSMPHQDAVIKIDRDTGELIWILGSPENWREPWSSRRLQPVGDLEWQYHEHGPSLTPHGTLVLFDNGGPRAGAFQEELPMEQQYSRAVEFGIDEANMEVEQVWSYGGPGEEQFSSGFLGDVDWLPVTGNLLITDGARLPAFDGIMAETDEEEAGQEDADREDEADEPAEAEDDPAFWGRVVEVTHTQPAEKVFELHIRESEGGAALIYRAERLPSLYP